MLCGNAGNALRVSNEATANTALFTKDLSSDN
jgi:hypothetical protein